MAERRVFTKEFKEEAVALAQASERTQTEIAVSLGIDVNMLSRWKREAYRAAKNGKIKVFPGKGNPRDEELVQLRKRIADLEETNEVLKKAVAIFTVRKPR
jgi:transposase